MTAEFAGIFPRGPHALDTFFFQSPPGALSKGAVVVGSYSRLERKPKYFGPAKLQNFSCLISPFVGGYGSESFQFLEVDFQVPCGCLRHNWNIDPSRAVCSVQLPFGILRV